MILTEAQVREHFEHVEAAQHWRTSYNIAPTQHGMVITNRDPGLIQSFGWGLIPYWANSPQNKGLLINARMEGIETKPSFRMPIRERRCLVLADSYYEWVGYGTQKRPYRIRLKDSPLMVMAGIWDQWTMADYSIYTFAIITAPAAPDIRHIHSRMPVILETKDQQARWLDALSLSDTLAMLHSLPAGKLNFYPVTPKLNRADFDSPECHVEVPEQSDLFSSPNDKS